MIAPIWLNPEESPGPHSTGPDDLLDPGLPLAVFFVGGEARLERLSLPSFEARYSKDYRQILFLSVGLVDQAWMDNGVEGAQNFKGTEEAERLAAKTRRLLEPCLDFARREGMKAASRVSISVDEAQELEKLSVETHERFPKSSFFLSKMVMKKRSWLHWLLHSDTSDAIRKRLERRGLAVTVLPVVLPG